MSYRKGTAVKYRAGQGGKGTSVGKIVKVVDGMAEIRTKNGATIHRNVAGLSKLNEDEESSRYKTPKVDQIQDGEELHVAGRGPGGQLVLLDNDEDGEGLHLLIDDEEE